VRGRTWLSLLDGGGGIAERRDVEGLEDLQAAADRLLAAVVVGRLVGDRVNVLDAGDVVGVEGGVDRGLDFGAQVIARPGRVGRLLDLGDDGEPIAPLDVDLRAQRVDGLRFGDVPVAERGADILTRIEALERLVLAYQEGALVEIAMRPA
jgi:hypothetical protein